MEGGGGQEMDLNFINSPRYSLPFDDDNYIEKVDQGGNRQYQEQLTTNNRESNGNATIIY
jgi:hypothetical protein